MFRFTDLHNDFLLVTLPIDTLSHYQGEECPEMIKTNGLSGDRNFNGFLKNQ
jgi:hypothetical protein